MTNCVCPRHFLPILCSGDSRDLIYVVFSIVVTDLIAEQRWRSDLAVAVPRQHDGRVRVVDDDGCARSAGKRGRVGRSEEADVGVLRRFHFQLGAPRGLAVDRRRHARVNAVIAFLQVWNGYGKNRFYNSISNRLLYNRYREHISNIFFYIYYDIKKKKTGHLPSWSYSVFSLNVLRSFNGTIDKR